MAKQLVQLTWPLPSSVLTLESTRWSAVAERYTMTTRPSLTSQT